MAHWNLSFDYATAFLLIMIIVWYFNEKRIPLKSHRVFLCFITVAFAATGLEIGAAHIARSVESFGFGLYSSVIHIQKFATFLIPIIFAYYILHLAHVNLNERKIIKAFLGIAVILNGVAISLNPFLKWAFTFENGRYVLGYASIILYVVAAAMILICLITMIKSSKEILFVKSAVIVFNITCGVAACIIQIFFNVPTLNFMIMVICLSLYYYLQNSGSVTDSVTRLFNRKFMGEYVQNEFLSQRRFGIISVAMDDFKFINKTYGVDNGDNLLLQVGGYLDSINANIAAFRFGSDQFCLVITKNIEDIGNIAELIQERFRHPWYNESFSGIMMSASICCIECPKEAENYGELIEVMDYSMAIAKKTRKGSITLASDVELDILRNDKAVEKAVKLAMDRDELMVYYQPIFSVGKGVYNSAEALVRLNDDKLGWISPEKFIPIAEKNGLIIEIGEMIFEKVCKFIRDFKLHETTIEYVEVNISPIQLVQIDFADRIIELMKKYEILPSQINIEITETATLGTVSVIQDNINKLVDYGINFSLDDYGSGYSNIDYINNMPFKIIKLDKYLIWDAFKNSKAEITLEYTIGMLNALELSIVAEGVETAEMRDNLVNIGCHYMQGWYYSKAICDIEFIELISQPVR